MRTKATINLICSKQEGVSKSTGNPWQKQEFVVQTENDKDGATSTMCFRTFNNDHIEKLAKCKEGDVVEVTYSCRATVRTFLSRNGVEICDRGNELRLLGFNVIEEAGY